MTQGERILDYIDTHGKITPMEAWEHLKITKLATRVSEMIRKGEKIEKRNIYYKDAEGKSKHYTEYRR